MAKIPTYIFEEHHEAFIAWHHATAQGVVPPAGNSVLHIDEHADIGSPRLHESIDSLGSDLERIARFTYRDLSIFEFLVPAIYQGFIQELVWIQPSVEKPSNQLVLIDSVDDRGRSFRVDVYPMIGKLPIGAPDRASQGRCRYRHQTLEAELTLAAPLIVDIDLDYFSCEDAVNVTQRLEVTEATYRSWVEDPYHFLRISQGSRVRMAEEEGRFVLYLKHYPDPVPMPLKVDEAVIEGRIEAVVARLGSLNEQPRMFDIARSRISGFTPNDQWEFIERRLLEALGRVYDLEIIYLSDVTATLPS